MFAVEVGSDELVDGEGRKSCIINPGDDDGKFRRQPEVPRWLAVDFALNKNGMCQRRGGGPTLGATAPVWNCLPTIYYNFVLFPGRARSQSAEWASADTFKRRWLGRLVMIAVAI
ncbi:hypothetical protein DdX_03085 [Ditylenchus destructor]|uniref:Uncharacterized protein n=1 Tax=Ditylenchus destructor TaxID=166010 RepID=A0AAD4NIP4_9BILA|nr:hypothetical protein DdX_03085 [Ditylenchus destructor]